MHQPVFLSLGSNLGSSGDLLAAAIIDIEKECGSVETQSSLYRSQAWGLEDQPDFFNQVVSIQTSLSPVILLKSILNIELRHGRIRGKDQWVARTLDIDILFFGNSILNLPDLTIPHPRIADRNFTLVPLMEIAPDYVHPKLGVTIEELYLQSADTLEVQMIES